MNRLVIVGAGGFGREVIQIVSAINAVAPTWDLVGVLDDSASSAQALANVPLLGPVERLATLRDHQAVVAVGSPAARARIVEANPGQGWATLVHPDTTISSDARLGAGCVVAPGARISVGCTLGNHVHVDQNVTIGHDCTVMDYVRLNPQACISGTVTLHERTLVGASATVLQGLTVAAESTVGAGAVVVRDVPASTTVKGVPAR